MKWRPEQRRNLAQQSANVKTANESVAASKKSAKMTATVVSIETKRQAYAAANRRSGKRKTSISRQYGQPRRGQASVKT